MEENNIGRCGLNLCIPGQSSMGNKRTSMIDGYDDLMEELEARGNVKKRAVPMEVDPLLFDHSDSVASPTKWFLGSQ